MRSRRDRRPEKLEQAAQVVALRTEGVGFRDIATRLGVSTGGAYNLYQRGLASVASDEVVEHRQRIDELAGRAIKGLLVLAEDETITPRTRVEAWSSLRGWADRLSKLHGCDVAEVEPIVVEDRSYSGDTFADAIAKRVLAIESGAS